MKPKTIFYIAGGDIVRPLSEIKDCTILCEMEGLYSDFKDIEKWVANEIGEPYTSRPIYKVKDSIGKEGITRRIVLGTRPY